MAKKMLIDASQPEEVRVAIVQGNKVEEFEFESTLRKQLKGNIYLAKVTRIEPSLQAAFVEYGGNRHGFLPLSEIHPDYYQIPQADRDALLADEEREAAEAQAAEDASEDEELEAAGEGAAFEPFDDDMSDEDGLAEEEAKVVEKPKKPRRPRRKKKADTAEADVAETGALEGEAVEADVAQAASDEGTVTATSVAEEAAAETTTEDTTTEDDGVDPEGRTQAAEVKEERIDGPLESETEENAAEPTEAVAAPIADEPAVEIAAVEIGAVEIVDSNANENAGDVIEAGEFGEADEGEADEGEADEGEARAEGEDEDGQPRKRARRRGGRGRRRKKNGEENGADETVATEQATGENEEADHSEPAETAEVVGGEDGEDDGNLAARRRARRRQYRIQEVIKPRQIMLVQVVKEERGNKGAALTTYLSLAGRYGVLMPNTARGGGISRKITNAADRKRLKGVVRELEVSKGMGLIVRTAGAQRTKAEIKRDYDYLMRLWESIRELTLKSVAPCLIYEEGSLIMRTIRDLYSKDVDAILVEGDDAYREAKGYMKMLMPSHAKNVQPYKDPVPLFQRYQVEAQLEQMIDPEVQLKSGGYLVINPTEALVSIDINSGRSTKEKNVEQTALRTNLEAAEEISRQLKMRDLAGLIVIDFIDMDEHRNNRSVEKRLKECLKNDRARIQVGRISQFGLLEMSRQRLGSSLLETATRTCPHCKGSGLLRTDDSAALSALRRIEEEAMRGKASEITVSLHPDIALYLLNHKREQIADIEQRHEIVVIIAADSSRRIGACEIERTKTRKDVRRDAANKAQETAISAVHMDDIDEDEDVGVVDDEEADEGEAVLVAAAPASKDEASTELGGDDQPKKRRRGRRGGRKRNKQGQNPDGSDADYDQADEAFADTLEGEDAAEEQTAAAEAVVEMAAEPDFAPAPVVEPVADHTPEPQPEPESEPATAAVSAVVETVEAEEAVAEEQEEKRVIPPVSEQEDPNKPKKKGWWSRVRGE